MRSARSAARMNHTIAVLLFVGDNNNIEAKKVMQAEGEDS